MNQQRRPFFQAVNNVNLLQRILEWVESRFRPCGRIAAILAVLLFTSCASLTPERVNLLAAIAGQAAMIGAQQWLAKHPEHRLSFEAVIAAIQSLIKAGVTNQAAYAELLNGLPTPTLAGPSGELYVTEDRLVIWDSELRKAVAVEGKAEAPVIRATVAGLKRGLAPLPPMPTVSRSGRTLVQVRKNRVVVPVPDTNVGLYPMTWTNPPPPPRSVFTPTVALTNLVAAGVSVAPHGARQSSAAPPLQPLLKTNVVRSVVDVTPNPGAASTVNIRWQMTQRSVYHIEHRNEDGTNWYKFGSLTNTSGMVPTNWVTTWNPVMPMGTWRVIRVR